MKGIVVVALRNILDEELMLGLTGPSLTAALRSEAAAAGVPHIAPGMPTSLPPQLPAGSNSATTVSAALGSGATANGADQAARPAPA